MPPKKKTAQEIAAVAKKRSGPAPKYDYDAARLEYIQGIEQDDGSYKLLTIKDIAERHDIPYTALRRRSSKERWTDRQNTYQSQIAQEKQKKRAKELAGQSIEFDKNAHNAAKLGISMASARLAEIAEEFRSKQGAIREARERLERGDPVEKWELYSAVNYRELEGLAGALERFQTVGMRALGTDVQRHELTSPDGSMTPQNINITAELSRDDPDRLGAFLQAAAEVGLLDSLMEDDSGVIDAEVVDDNTNEEDSE